MASPQKENGYVPLANELIEALAKIRIKGEAIQVLWVILRKTYGFNKKRDSIALSQFSSATGIKKQNILRSINLLVSMKVIIVIKKDNGEANTYEINKDFDEWVPLSKKITLSKKIMGVINKDKNRNPKRLIQKTKDTITKDIPAIAEHFSSSETRDRWYEGGKDDFTLLAWFFDKKKLWVKFDSRQKVESAVKRHIRPARRILNAGWTQIQVEKELARILKNEKMSDEWTLETLEKYLTK